MHFPDSHGGNQNTSCVPLDQALNLPGPRFCLYELGSLTLSPGKTEVLLRQKMGLDPLGRITDRKVWNCAEGLGSGCHWTRATGSGCRRSGR